MKVLKYVDNGAQLETVNMENSEEEEREGVLFKIKHAVPSQNVIHYVVNKATARGMKVNALKTSMICISDAQTSTSEFGVIYIGLRR